MPTNGGLKMKYEMIDCPECKGKGIEKVFEECGYCDGWGKIKSDYIIIDDPVEAVVFLDKPFLWLDDIDDPDNKREGVHLFGMLSLAILGKGNSAIFYKSVVKEVCKDGRARSLLLWDMGYEQVDEFDMWYRENKK